MSTDTYGVKTWTKLYTLTEADYGTKRSQNPYIKQKSHGIRIVKPDVLEFTIVFTLMYSWFTCLFTSNKSQSLAVQPQQHQGLP